MYVIVKYKLTKDNGRGSKTFTPVEVVDTSENIDKFEHLIRSKASFKVLGSGDITNLYRGHKKILMDLERMENEHGTMHRIRNLIRKSKLENLLD